MAKLLLISPIIWLLWACNTNNNSQDQETPSSNTTTIIKASPLEKLTWLLGDWVCKKGDIQIYESWTKANDSLFLGTGSTIKNQADTLSSETIRLEARQEQLYYIPVVSNQNEGENIEFKLISNDPEEWIFENPSHDFPQRIIYHQPSPDSLHARIEGTIKGQPRSTEFPMARIR
ncbi:MAG: hypothetical protein GY810_29555 [Aureispira sp.]|nr:hypothetical protein [Aureispira sp.]